MVAAGTTDVCVCSRRRSCGRMTFPLTYGVVLTLNALLHLGVICSVEALLCNCTDPYLECKSRNFTCEVPDHTGVCATYWRWHSWSRMEYSCLLHHGVGFDKLSCFHVPGKTHVACCNSSDFCNGALNVSRPTGGPTISTTTLRVVTVRGKSNSSRNLEIALPFAFLFAGSVVALIILAVYYRRKRSADDSQSSRTPLQGGAAGRDYGVNSVGGSYDSYNVSRMLAHPIGGMVRPPPGTADHSSSRFTSGSGSGAVYLVQRTLSREIELHTCIGKGRFGEVHSGVWQGEDVAVKIFYSRDEQSWLCETQIYNSVLLRHEHILTFYGSDVRSNNDCTELWLITQYHAHGSLYDYLVDNEMNVETALKFAYSIASGLNHLHTEIQGTCGKRSIAHRDLKSKNILVKEDLNCCIADLGLAVMHDPDSDEPPDVPNHKVGTKRYMSPEMLSESINVHRFNAFRCADIYALGLVLWEVGRRCRVDGDVCSYELPYYDHLMSDPSVEEVREVVVVAKHRPVVPDHLFRNTYSRHLAYTMRDCWRENPGSRVTALRIKKTFYELKKKHPLPVVIETVENQAVTLLEQPIANQPLANGHVVHLPELPTSRESSPASHAKPDGGAAESSQVQASVQGNSAGGDGRSSSGSHCSRQTSKSKQNGHVSQLEDSAVGNGHLHRDSSLPMSSSSMSAGCSENSGNHGRVIYIGGWSEGSSVSDSRGSSWRTRMVESSC